MNPPQTRQCPSNQSEKDKINVQRPLMRPSTKLRLFLQIQSFIRVNEYLSGRRCIVSTFFNNSVRHVKVIGFV